jgi:acyl carrier protein
MVMEEDATWQMLTGVFRRVFSDDVKIDRATTSDDVSGWDSLNHIRLMVAVEKTFRIRFSPAEVTVLKNVGDLFDEIRKKMET